MAQWAETGECVSTIEPGQWRQSIAYCPLKKLFLGPIQFFIALARIRQGICSGLMVKKVAAKQNQDRSGQPLDRPAMRYRRQTRRRKQGKSERRHEPNIHRGTNAAEAGQKGHQAIQPR